MIYSLKLHIRTFATLSDNNLKTASQIQLSAFHLPLTSAFITTTTQSPLPSLQHHFSSPYPSRMSLPSIANLMSPPEAKPLDSYSITPAKTPSTTQLREITPDQTLAPMANRKTPDTKLRVLPSPPISPWLSKRQHEEKSGQTTNIRGGGSDKDPVLFPELESESFGSVIDQPLFSSEPLVAQTEEIITKHMAMHMHQFDKKISCPTREEYRLAIACVPQVGRLYNRNPGAYMKRQREEMDNQYWQTKRICANPGSKAAPVAIAPAPKQLKRPINRVPTPSKAPVARIKRTPKASPIAKLMGYPDKGRSATPDRLPGAKREDIDYNALPDYSPPTSTLQNAKSLKADWPSSNILNLSNDPDRHMLHEAEINLAGTLRLTCATYICSKRRIFEARLNALRIGKEFRKTDAQQACKIDVNKASKLWTAYDKVDWFKEDLFKKYL